MDAQHHKIAYVTGSSRGIGKALVKSLIADGYQVIGISRSNDFESDSYRFDKLDLSDLDAVQNYAFDKTGDEVLLVNNAGLIGDIGPTGNIDNSSIRNVMNVNTIAPQILTNNFIKKYTQKKGKYHIINISSGAGKQPIDAWATYCASKAAIDLFSETVAEELEWRGHHNFTIHSTAPGVVDTQMQVEIRSSDISDFKEVERFKELKSEGNLSSPEAVADKLMMMIKSPESFPKVVNSVRDF